MTDEQSYAVMDKTLTPSPWTTLMDYPNGLPKWTTLKWTTSKNTISEYILTLHDLIIIIIIILLKFKFNRFLKLTQPAYSIANRGGLCNLQ